MPMEDLSLPEREIQLEPSTEELSVSLTMTLPAMRLLNYSASMRQWIEDGLDIYKVNLSHYPGSAI